jgi:antitoxin (DNA-binding transcriptional repressor) of toxin-antitoxin stability system
MCYQVRHGAHAGGDPLRQNLSVYIHRVLEGSTFEVTEHGHPVALLGPLPEGSTALGRLVRQG